MSSTSTELTDEQQRGINKIIEWVKTMEIDEAKRHRILTYGTDTDKLLLLLYDEINKVIT
jgi:hypothetical protein